MLPITPRPLSELNMVDWKKYRHAYGPAGDIPKLLRAIAEAPAAGNAQEVNWLGNRIFHEGVAPVHRVTLAVLPFVLGLVIEGNTPHRARLLKMLWEMLQSMKDFRGHNWPKSYQPPEWQELERELLALGPLLSPLIHSEDSALAIAASQYFNVWAWYTGRSYAGRMAEIESLPEAEVRETVLAHAIDVWA